MVIVIELVVATAVVLEMGIVVAKVGAIMLSKMVSVLVAAVKKLVAVKLAVAWRIIE